jgi:hypothetical protein
MHKSQIEDKSPSNRVLNMNENILFTNPFTCVQEPTVTTLMNKRKVKYCSSTDSPTITSRWAISDEAISLEAAKQERNQTMAQQILYDLGSTYSDTKMDVLINTEVDKERGHSPCLWESSEESSEDTAVDPLFFYSSRCEESKGEEEIPVYEPTLVISQVSPPIFAGSSPSVGKISFAGMKPLYGHLLHSSSTTTATTATTQSSTESFVRLRDYQCEQWAERFEELRKFVAQHGHCQVSHQDGEHGALARWTKRQRYQYKLMKDGKQSTMTPARVEDLNGLGFAWNSHEATWNERFDELHRFSLAHGHCSIPSCYEPNQKLATWAKCQRRQYKLLVSGNKSNMTWRRVARLEEIGFVWEIRLQIHPES